MGNKSINKKIRVAKKISKGLSKTNLNKGNQIKKSDK